MPQRVLVVDDHPIIRFGVGQLLKQRWPEVQVDEASTIAQGIAIIAARKPDLVVLDLDLPDATGTEGVFMMLQANGNPPLLVLSLSAETVFAARLLKMGVWGYLPKDMAAKELVPAVENILAGRRFVTATMASHLVDFLGVKNGDGLPHESLSKQEYRVMLMIAEGRQPAEIAEIMGLSVKTVGTYRARLLDKAHWKSNNELTRYCVQHGLTA